MNILGNEVALKSNSKTIMKFVLLIFIIEFVRGAYMNFLPLYSRDFLRFDNVGLIGIVFFVYFFLETVSKIGFGWLLDRFNNKVILLCGLFISFSGFCILKYAYNPIHLVISGALIGLGFSPVWLIVFRHNSLNDHEQKTSNMGLIYSAWLAGLGLGMMTISFMISKSFSFAIGILTILWFISIIIAVFMNLGISVHTNQTHEKHFDNKIFKEIFNAKKLLPGMILQTFSITLLTPILAIYFTGSLGLTVSQYGLAQAVIGIVLVAGLAVLTKFTHRIETEKLFIFGLFITSVSIFAVGHIFNITYVLIFGIIAGIGYAIMLPAWYTIMSNNISKTNAGLMWGVFTTLEGIGTALGPLVGGVIGQHFGLHFSFTICSGIILFLAVFYFLLNRRSLLKY